MAILFFMKITFLGTGAAEGFPAMFCSCRNCIAARRMGGAEVRTRTQVLVDGDLSVDFPPEAYAHSVKYGVNLSALSTVLVTHSHMDHFYAHDFILRGYKYAQLQAERLQLYGNAEVCKVFAECTRREMKAEVAERVGMQEIKPYTVFRAGDYRVIALPARHSVTEQALLFYIEKGGKGYLHLHDTGVPDDRALAFLAENGAYARLVAFDCTFVDSCGGANARHMGIEENMAVKNKLLSLGVCGEDSRYVITHFSHNANPTRERLAVIGQKYGVTAAYDGMEMEI